MNAISATEATVERTHGEELDDAWWALSLSTTLLATSYNFGDAIEGWTSPGGLRPDYRLFEKAKHAILLIDQARENIARASDWIEKVRSIPAAASA